MKMRRILNALMSVALLAVLTSTAAHAETLSSAPTEALEQAKGSEEGLGLAVGTTEDLLRPGYPTGPYRPRPRSPRPYPPRPYPVDLCRGGYAGSYSNGVQGVMYFNGYNASINLNGYLFSGYLDCRNYGHYANVYYQLSHPAFPGVAEGHGSITLGQDGRAYLHVNQNNGLTFSAVR